jgi:VanZ family protein
VRQLSDTTRFHLPLILWALVIFTASSIPGYSIPESPIFEQDKLLHAGIFFGLAFFMQRSFSHQSRFPGLARHSRWWILAFALAYGILDEVHQSFVPGRTPDVFDALADGTGAAIFLLLQRIMEWLRGRPKSRD